MPRSRAAVIPSCLRPTMTRSPKPSAAMSSSKVMFIGPMAPSVRGRQRLGALLGQRDAVDRDRALARLGAEQLEAELVVGVALPQHAARQLPGVGFPARRLAAALRVPHLDPGTRYVYLKVRGADNDHRGGVDRTGQGLAGARFHSACPPLPCVVRLIVQDQ